MSTIAPPSKPIPPALLDSEHYIDREIRRTRRALKLADLAAGVLTLAIGLLAFMLIAAVLDHWVVPGGLNEAGRVAVFGVMLLGLLWYGWRYFVPLLRPINPVYAAHTIERGTPSLKNSLLNLLLFRTHRQHMSARVYHALEQQAAQRLSTSAHDVAVDRSSLLRLGYALLAIIAVCAAYSVFSPKNMGLSAVRVLAPWSDLPAPSRVQIMNITPGDSSVARGERLEITATIGGLRSDDPVRVHYSTADEQLVDESVSMKTPDAGVGRFVAELPRGGDAAVEAGVQQDLVYWIEAGDAHSKKFNVTVFQRPTIIVQKVRYEYPAYTGFPSSEVDSTGDIRGLEGTRVTVSALANQPIKSAYVDFDADGRSDLRMTVEGDHAVASFPLALREDRRTPKHVSYVLKFTSTEGRSNIDPPKYRIDVTPDYAPEVRVTSPEEPERTVRVDETLPIGVEARDPDFALSGVRLVGKVGDREATLAELLSKKHEGRFGAIRPFTPGEAQLKPGDTLEYWAEARDNRRPDANVALSEHRRLKIAGPADQPPPQGQQQQQQPGGPQQPGGQKQNGENAQGGEQGEGGPQQQGEQAGADGEAGENQGQQGPGGAGAKGQQNEKGQSEEGAGGAGQSGQSQSNDAQQQPGAGGAGGSSANNAEQSQDPQQQPSQGANNGAGAAGKPQAGQQQPKPGANPGEPEQSGQPQDGQQGAPQEKVSSDGSDDATAMQKLAEQLNPQGAAEQSGAPNQQGQPQNAADQNNAAQTGAEQNASAQNPGEAASRTQGKPNAGEPASAGGPNAQQEGSDPATSKPNATDQAGQPGSKSTPPDASTNAANGGKNQSNQKPPAEGAQPGGPRETPSDAEQQAAPAGENPSKRQGADVPRDSRNGDGNPNDPKGAEQPSPDSAMNKNDGDAGSGGSTGKEQGAPVDEVRSHRKAVNKTDEDNKKRMDDEEPPMPSPDKKESNSRGGQGGEQSGGGQEGGGQKADAAGKGDAGQHEAADEGAGRADEQGQGETGTKPGGDQLAEGKTGESSGDKKGQGSQQGAPGESASAGGPDGKQPGAKPQPKPGQPGGQQPGQQGGGEGQTQSPPGEQSPQASEGAQPGGKQGAGDPAGKPPEGGERPDSKDGKPGEQKPSDQPSGGGQAGASQPQGGGQGGVGQMTDQPTTEEAKEDEANLAFARKQTDLVLERLDDQLAKKQVDANLLKSLGWNEAELRQFVNRWKDLKTRAAGEGEASEKAQQELDGALLSLGLRPHGPTRVQATSKADKLRVNDSARNRAPMEYADRVREYYKGVGSDDK